MSGAREGGREEAMGFEKRRRGVYSRSPTFLFSASLTFHAFPPRDLRCKNELALQRRNTRVQAFGSKWPARGSDSLTGIPFHAFNTLAALGEQKNTTVSPSPICVVLTQLYVRIDFSCSVDRLGGPSYHSRLELSREAMLIRKPL